MLVPLHVPPPTLFQTQVTSQKFSTVDTSLWTGSEPPTLPTSLWIGSEGWRGFDHSIPINSNLVASCMQPPPLHSLLLPSAAQFLPHCLSLPFLYCCCHCSALCLLPACCCPLCRHLCPLLPPPVTTTLPTTVARCPVFPFAALVAPSAHPLLLPRLLVSLLLAISLPCHRRFAVWPLPSFAGHSAHPLLHRLLCPSHASILLTVWAEGEQQ